MKHRNEDVKEVYDLMVIGAISFPDDLKAVINASKVKPADFHRTVNSEKAITMVQLLMALGIQKFIEIKKKAEENESA